MPGVFPPRRVPETEALYVHASGENLHIVSTPDAIRRLLRKCCRCGDSCSWACRILDSAGRVRKERSSSEQCLPAGEDSLPCRSRIPGLPPSADGVCIVIGCHVTGLAALKQAVIALGVEQAVFVKSGFLETVVDVCGQDEIILSADQVIENVIYRCWRIHIPIDVNVAAPVSPVFFQI